ncbi:MAG: OmpA family protein [Candidatus Azobacteroides sp.]|nr:OmpA family protein [Candidatus Azobacteroides sp.]
MPDYLDKCPNTPAGVAVDQYGCPIDSDGDGVADYMDECPNTPAGVTVDSKGCPIDSDGDGVPDYLDKCPNTPAGVAVDQFGCPIDTDGDGVPDYLDKCPTIPGTVANDGCPELKETEKAVFEKALRGIQFATGKDIITKASYPILDAIVMIMRENPTYFLTINGHTDNVGKPESNQILSEKRAAAVRNYIVSNGVDAGRLTIRGFGDTQPLVPNTTAANRTLNRRVEFIVKFEKEIEVAK